MVIFADRCELNYHRPPNMIFHQGMHLLSTFILAGFRVSAYVFKNVIKGEDHG